jgi:hypothetical protein
MNESAIKAKIVKYLKTVPGLWWCHVPGNGYGRPGIPDYICCFNGRFIALEVKAEGGKPTKWQQREMDAITAAFGEAHVVRSVEDVQLALSVTAKNYNMWGNR